MRMVAVGKFQFRDRLRAAQTFRHILSGHFEMHARSARTFGVMDGEEFADFGQNIGELARFISVGLLDGVAVHLVATPHHLAAFFFQQAHERR